MKDGLITEELIDAAYRRLMSQTPDARVEEAEEYAYALIEGYADFANLEEAINAYAAATEKRGFREGLIAGLRIASDAVLLKELQARGPIH